MLVSKQQRKLEKRNVSNTTALGKSMSDIDPENNEVVKKKRTLPEAMRKKQFKKGQGGRPKGAKNKVTLLREAVLANAETTVLEQWDQVVKTTLELAQKGDSTCLKILWDRMVPTRKATDDSQGVKKDYDVTIKIERLESAKIVSGEVVEAEFIAIDDKEVVNNG